MRDFVSLIVLGFCLWISYLYHNSYVYNPAHATPIDQSLLLHATTCHLVPQDSLVCDHYSDPASQMSDLRHAQAICTKHIHLGSSYSFDPGWEDLCIRVGQKAMTFDAGKDTPKTDDDDKAYLTHFVGQ